jgi:hypothetical protein
MELAEYYGGAPSGGAFSGGLMNPMQMKMAHLRSLRGGVGKKTKRVNRQSEYMKCKKRQYATAMDGYLSGLNPIKPKWAGFVDTCPRGVRQPRLPRVKKPLSAARKQVLKQRRAAIKLLKEQGAYEPRAMPERLARGLSAYRARTGCNIDGQMLSLPQLKAQAKLLGLKGFSKMKKADLCAALSGNLPMF